MKKNTKKKNNNQTNMMRTCIFIVILCLLLLIVSLVLYVVSKKNNDNDLGDNVTYADLITYADYSKEAKPIEEEYEDKFGTKYSFNIKVVQVNNIKSRYVKTVNDELKSVYVNAVKKYNECYNIVKSGAANAQGIDTCGIVVEDMYYEYGDIISILVAEEYVDNLDVYNPVLRYYFINKETGEKVTVSKLFTQFGVTEEDVKNAAMKSYREFASIANINYSSEDFDKTQNNIISNGAFWMVSDNAIEVKFDAYYSNLSKDRVYKLKTTIEKGNE